MYTIITPNGKAIISFPVDRRSLYVIKGEARDAAAQYSRGICQTIFYHPPHPAEINSSGASRHIFIALAKQKEVITL